MKTTYRSNSSALRAAVALENAGCQSARRKEADLELPGFDGHPDIDPSQTPSRVLVSRRAFGEYEDLTQDNSPPRRGPLRRYAHRSIPTRVRGCSGHADQHPNGNEAPRTATCDEATPRSTVTASPQPESAVVGGARLDPISNIAPDRATLTIPEAARILGISRSTAYELARTGELPVLRLGRRLVIPTRALNRLLESVGNNPN